jgi:predicted DNA-binding mobile mystery protein A
MDESFKLLARRQLSAVIEPHVTAAAAGRPPQGWIGAIRESLDMTARQLAARLHVAPSNVVRLEQRERNGTVSLQALQAAAAALGCDLVYGVVPRAGRAARPATGTLDALIEARAREVALAELRRISHTMALEDQTVTPADLEAQIAERAAELARSPRRLWDDDAGPPPKKSPVGPVEP